MTPTRPPRPQTRASSHAAAMAQVRAAVRDARHSVPEAQIVRTDGQARGWGKRGKVSTSRAPTVEFKLDKGDAVVCKGHLSLGVGLVLERTVMGNAHVLWANGAIATVRPGQLRRLNEDEDTVGSDSHQSTSAPCKGRPAHGRIVTGGFTH